MRVAILAVGSRGDVQPHIALGVGLQRAGHQVTLATHDVFREAVTEHGITFAQLSGDPLAILTNRRQNILRGGTSSMPMLRELARAGDELARQIAGQSLEAARGADVILYSMTCTFIAPSVAERLGVPALPAYHLPLSVTAAFPNPLFPQTLRGPMYNRLTYVALEQLVWQLRRRTINGMRREVLDLPPLPFSGQSPAIPRRSLPHLYGYSRHVVPKPADWGSNLHVTGYWFLDDPISWQPPRALLDFLAAGPPPVCITFGSTPGRDPEASTALTVRALQRAGQRGLLITGWGGLTGAALPDEVFAVESVPYEWLFPHVAAVVHHGGAGTLASVLRFGLPSVVVPHMMDQPFWAFQAQRLRVAAAPINHKQLSAERLAAAIRRVVGDPGMRERAARLATLIRAESGTAVATNLIEQYVRNA